MAKDKEFECVLHEYSGERLKRNCLLAHGNSKMNSSHEFKGENPTYFVAVKTENYWKRLSRELLALLSLKGFMNRLDTSVRNDS